jgi:serine protease Do
MNDSLDWEADGKPQRPDACALDLKKYFYFIGATALVILAGTYWFTEHYQPKAGGASLFAMPDLMGTKPAGNKRPPAVNARRGVRNGDVTQTAPRGEGNRGVNSPTEMVRAREEGRARQERNEPGMRVPVQQRAPMQQQVPMQQLAMGPAAPVMQNVGSGGFASVAMALRNSVVNISTTNGRNVVPVAAPGADTIRFANPFSKRARGSIGSGIIIRNDGYIISNYHIVRGAGGVVVTVFGDQGSQRYQAKIIKMDEVMDLVLLKINPPAPLRAAMLADSDKVRVADEVLAIGSPFGLDQTVSRGIVSALRKSLAIEGITHANLIQTDAAINQGNSGGALVGSDGAVIGINTAIYTPTGAFSGIGFAIPANQVRQFMLDEIGQPLAAARGFTAAAPGQQTQSSFFGMNIANPNAPAPRISANDRTPGNHKRDGRDKMNCMTCHQIKGAAAPAAFRFAQNSPAFGMATAAQNAPAPRIAANDPIPGNHKRDGRDKMNCMSCHQIKGAAAAAAFQPAQNSPAFGMAVAAQNAPAPRISANERAPGNHKRDGRDKMNCMTCHQIKGAAAQAGFAFTKPPSTLAMNVAVPTANFGVPGSNFGVMGAGIMSIDAALAERINHPRDKGVFVSQVAMGSPADLGGLKTGDIILKADGRRLWAPGQLADLMKSQGNGNLIRLSILRDGNRERLDMLVALEPAKAQNKTAPAQSAVTPARVLPKEFNWRGINIENFVTVGMPTAPGEPAPGGAKVDGIKRGSAAAKTGLKPRDIILKINSQPVGKPVLFDQAIRKAKGQTSNLLLVLRGNREFFVMLP